MYDLDFDHEVAVIGGGVAGLAAALLLGRATIPTAVIAAPASWRPDSPAHNFLTNDGKPVAQILAEARRDVERYDSVRFLDGHVRAVAHDGIGYTIERDGADPLFVQRLILADGNRLDPKALGIAGLERLWGQRFFTCPYCHAHEYRGRRFGLIGTSANDANFARILGNWAAEVTLFAHHTVPATEPAPYPMVTGQIAAVDETGDGALQVTTAQGRHEVDVLFAADLPPVDPQGGLAAGLGLDRVPHPLNGKPIWKADATGRTDLGSCFVIGDARTGFSTLTGAANEGQIAGFMMVNDIIEARQRAPQPAF